MAMDQLQATGITVHIRASALRQFGQGVKAKLARGERGPRRGDELGRTPLDAVKAAADGVGDAVQSDDPRKRRAGTPT